MYQRYLKCCAAVSVLLIGGLYLSTQLFDYNLTSRLSNLQRSGANAVQWALTRAGLDTNSSLETSVSMASQRLHNVSLDSNITDLSQSGHSTSGKKSLKNQQTTPGRGCNLTPPADVILPNNTLYLATPCSHPDPRQTFVPKSVQMKMILVYNRPEWFHADDRNYRHVLAGCGLSHACMLTDNRTFLQKADAVLVHVPRLKDAIPYPPSTHRSARQIWIAFGMESPVHYEGHYDSPAWKSVFNWTFTYRTDSDIFNPYAFLSLKTESPAKNYTQVALKKTKAVAWFVSNCNTPSRRELYVQELRRHIDVDIYGVCGSLKCPRQTENDCLRLLNESYHFYLSFENSLCRDYVTEKLFKIYDNVDVIPVVRGRADYDRYFPPNTYINTAHFRSPQDLASSLKRLMADTEAYARMLRLKDWFQKKVSVWNAPCRICKKLHEPQLQDRVIPDFMQWMRKNDACRPPTDV